MHVPQRFRGILVGMTVMVVSPVVLGMLNPESLASAHLLKEPVPEVASSVLQGGPTPFFDVVAVEPSASSNLGYGPTPDVVLETPTPIPAASEGPIFQEPSANSIRAYALSILPKYGWTGTNQQTQFACLDALWGRESGWNPTDSNPYSGAYGIPQAVPGSKMAAFGSDWRTNPDTQIAWGLSYIVSRYGDPCGAWDHSQEDGWY